MTTKQISRSRRSVWPELWLAPGRVDGGRLSRRLWKGFRYRGRRAADGSDGQTRLSTVEAALFETGRPVMIAPPVPTRTFGEIVVIAGTGAPETARAVLGSMPLLKKARRIIVLELDDWGVPGPSGRSWSGPCECTTCRPIATAMAPDPSDRPGESS